MKFLAALAVALAVALLLGSVAVIAGPIRGPSGSGTIVLEDLRFTPNRLDAKAGVPITVRLTNMGTERHDLDFPSLHMPGLNGVESILDPGETRTLTLEFDQPGIHTFICSLPGHAAAGMTGAVYVSR